MISPVYDEVQVYLTQCGKDHKEPIIHDIGKAVYKKDYDPDSLYQRNHIYGAIYDGRNIAFRAWREYSNNRELFDRDIEYIEFYQQDLVNKEVKSEDYGEYNIHLYRGKFGEFTTNLKKYPDEYACIATLWRKKVKEFSEQGKNLVIADYGRNSTWSRPSWWKWAIRETSLFKRGLGILKMQLERGQSAEILLPSGKPLSKAIGYVDSTRALIEDGTSWICSCGMHNVELANYCSNCGRTKT